MAQDSFSPYHWGARQWLSVSGIFLFSAVGTTIQLVYIFKLWKRRDDTIMQKHFLARGKGLFLTHCLLNLYWSSVHPIVIGLPFILYPDNIIVLITSYCYTLVLLDSLMAIFCIRCWILYFNFNYLALQFEKLWKTKLLNQHYNLSWFETHKSLGNPLWLIIIGSIVTVLLCILTIPYAYVSELRMPWHVLFGAGVFLTDIFAVLLILKLHSIKHVDNFGMRHELTIFVLVMLTMTLITVAPFFMISDDWIRLWIITILIYCSTLFVNIFQFNTILTEIHASEIHQLHDVDVESIKLIEVLSDSMGINEFARFLIGEFSLEHLLFLIEVSQFRFQFEITTPRNAKTFQFNPDKDKYEYRYQLSDAIPLCATIIDHDEPVAQAQAIKDKFILKASPFQINISGAKRNEILGVNWNDIGTAQLKHIFDAAYNEVWHLLELDSFKRYLATASTAGQLAKKLLKKRKRNARQRSKSRGNRIKKRVKEKEKRRERRHSAHTIQLSSPPLQSSNTSNKMTKSVSLGSGQRNRSYSTNEIVNSRENEPASDDEQEKVTDEQLADPFHSLTPSDGFNKPRNSALERNLHNVLHSASSSTKCCGCANC